MHRKPSLLHLGKYIGLDTEYTIDVLALIGAGIAFTAYKTDYTMHIKISKNVIDFQMYIPKILYSAHVCRFVVALLFTVSSVRSFWQSI